MKGFTPIVACSSSFSWNCPLFFFTNDYSLIFLHIKRIAPSPIATLNHLLPRKVAQSFTISYKPHHCIFLTPIIRSSLSSSLWTCSHLYARFKGFGVVMGRRCGNKGLWTIMKEQLISWGRIWVSFGESVSSYWWKQLLVSAEITILQSCIG